MYVLAMKKGEIEKETIEEKKTGLTAYEIVK